MRLAIPIQIADDSILVEVDNKFITLSATSSPISVSKNNIATYELTTSRTSSSRIDLSLNVTLNSISQKDFNKFSIPSGAYIRTFIKVTGVRSGAQKIIEVRIS